MRMAMIAITTNNSINVNPRFLDRCFRMETVLFLSSKSKMFLIRKTKSVSIVSWTIEAGDSTSYACWQCDECQLVTLTSAGGHLGYYRKNEKEKRDGNMLAQSTPNFISTHDRVVTG